jgi:hypothetical protein
MEYGISRGINVNFMEKPSLSRLLDVFFSRGRLEMPGSHDWRAPCPFSPHSSIIALWMEFFSKPIFLNSP